MTIETALVVGLVVWSFGAVCAAYALVFEAERSVTWHRVLVLLLVSTLWPLLIIATALGLKIRTRDDDVRPGGES